MDVDTKFSHLRRESRAQLQQMVADDATADEVAEYADTLGKVEAARRHLRKAGKLPEGNTVYARDLGHAAEDRDAETVATCGGPVRMVYR